MERTARMRGSAALIAVVAVVVVLVAVLGIWLAGRGGGPPTLSNEMRTGMTQHRLAVLEAALLAFKRDVGRFPTQSEGLKALITAPEGVTDYPEGGYIEPLMLEDGWGHAFVYRLPADTGIPVVISGGADGRIDGTGPPADLWVHPADALDVNVPDINLPEVNMPEIKLPRPMRL